MDYLSNKNAHERDKLISFQEEGHLYTINGERGTYMSCTTFVHTHFAEFDADKIIDNMMKSRNMTDPNYKYYGMTKDEIKNMWEEKRNSASKLGTQTHYDVESYYNNVDVVNDTIEYAYFKEFVRDYPNLKPYRTEWTVFYEEYKLCGSIDMVYENPDGTVEIYDWKRCTEIQYENLYNRTSNVACISHVHDTNYWHYSLQLNIYKKILEDKYNKKVTGLYLVCIHPNNWNKTYQRIEVQVMTKETQDIFNNRLLSL